MKSRPKYFVWLFPLAAALSLFSGCGSGGEESSMAPADPEWRSKVKPEITFPLEEQVTVTIGSGGGNISEEQVMAGEAGNMAASAATPGGQKNISLQWLQDYTNIDIELIGLPSSPGDVLLGEMIRDGALPDIVPEQRFDLRTAEFREMFVNILEFPALIPNILRLYREDSDFASALMRRYTDQNELLSAGTYTPFEKPMAGVIAFREDLFRRHGLAYDTWEELYDSMKRLKSLYPDSYPFGGTSDLLTGMGPAWFGSGYRSREVVYYKPETGLWTFGPFEPEFREFLEYFRRLYAEELLLPEYVMIRREDLPRYWLNQSWFIAPYEGATGLQFRWRSGEYGNLTVDGEWDGTGSWISAMKIPRGSSGKRGRVTSSSWTNLSSGWLVNNQSPHVAEALALLDLLYREDVALVMRFGPQGVLWEERGGEPRFLPAIQAPYNPAGGTEYRTYLKEQGLSVGLPVQGLDYNPESILGLTDQPYYKYYLKTDVGNYLDEGSIGLYPVPAVIFADDQWSEIAGIAVSLTTHVESYLANYIVGRTGADSYDEFLEKCRKMGAERLQELYNQASISPATVPGMSDGT